jgi:hypothetical protein
MTDNTQIGIESTGDKINWRNLNEERIDDPIISALIKEAEILFIKKQTVESSTFDNNLHLFIKPLNDFLKQNKYKYKISEFEHVEAQKIQVGKKKVVKLSKKDIILQQIKETKYKEDIDKLLKSLKFNNNHPFLIKKPIESFLIILVWAIYLIANKKNSIDISIYFDCVVSLYRAIKDSLFFLPESLINESNEILNELESVFYTKVNEAQLFTFISRNLNIILDSSWDKDKPKSISLYQEQKDMISLISSNLNQKKLIFFEMPPANGKTILSAILAKVIAHKNKENLLSIPNYKRKTVLYICYNSIVRNEVAKLCITHNVDVRYWLAVTQQDKEDGKIKTFLRPYKNCYPDWNKRGARSKKEEKEYSSNKWKKFSENIHDQWEFFMDETRPISEQHTKLSNYLNAPNLPEMIISDLDSAYQLLKEFPDTFVTYFDEAFAASELEITSKIMSVMGFTVLVSATLAKPEEIPTVITHYRERHHLIDDTFLHVIKSNKQHISCTFIDETGNMFAPHDSVESFDLLHDFIPLLETPLIKRGYSPEILFDMSAKIDNMLPPQLKFKSIFKNLGMMTHESIRDYACLILKYIDETLSVEIFDRLKSNITRKIDNMNVNTIFTNSASFYQGNKTLHVASLTDFNNHVDNISRDFLRDSPKISDMFSQFDKEQDIIKSKIKHLEKNYVKDVTDYEISLLENELSNLTFKWPSEFLMNSRSHANKFSNLSKLIHQNNEIFGSKSDLDSLDDTRAKLFLSSIGIYQPEIFSGSDMNLFLKNKDKFKFIISTPSIVYGTNISLSIIDIDSSFAPECNKNTLYQLIGRAGRKGKSTSACIVFRDRNMLNIIFENNIVNREAINIETNYQNIF